MEIIDSEAADQPQRLIDKVKQVIVWLEWEAFSIEDLCTGLDIHGHEGYNVGQIKSAVLPALVRARFIRTVEGSEPPAFVQVAQVKKTNGKEQSKIDAPTVREATGTAPKTKRSGPKMPTARPIMQALMIVEQAPIDAATLHEKLCHYTGCEYNIRSARRFLWDLAHRKMGMAIKLPQEQQKHYLLNDSFFNRYYKRKAIIMRAMPECRKEIEAAFKKYKGIQNQSKKKRPYVKSDGKLAPLAAILISENRPLYVYEIAGRLQRYTGKKTTSGSVSALLNYYRNKYKYIESIQASPGKKRKTLHKIGQAFYDDYQHYMDDVLSAIPELKDAIEKNLSRIYEQPQTPPEAPAPTQTQPENSAPDQDQTGQDMMPAIDLGNAIIQYCNEMKREIKRLKEDIKNRSEYKELKYKIDDMAGLMISKDNQIMDLKGQLKKTKKLLENAKNTIENHEQNIAKLTNKVDTMRINTPKTSFKMSEVANIKRALDGDETLKIAIQESA